MGTVSLYGIHIVSLVIEGQERLCLAQISNTLLKQFSYNEIHNRRVALGITCVQCTPVQLEILRRAGAMPVSSRRCGMITRREAERLCKSFLGDNAPPRYKSTRDSLVKLQDFGRRLLSRAVEKNSAAQFSFANICDLTIKFIGLI